MVIWIYVFRFTCHFSIQVIPFLIRYFFFHGNLKTCPFNSLTCYKKGLHDKLRIANIRLYIYINLTNSTTVLTNIKNTHLKQSIDYFIEISVIWLTFLKQVWRNWIDCRLPYLESELKRHFTRRKENWHQSNYKRDKNLKCFLKLTSTGHLWMKYLY